ncbi:MAG: DUF1761 domain-containing protein [Caldisericales bacterium]|jgi:hypothetical protein|nr:DUF1761 domain-containing protein [bacterium]NMD13900.1 DUF1761 domain-containing protein [Caldisericales bacterium]
MLRFDFSQINYLAVLVASVAAFIVGFIYYMPGVMGNLWIKALGKDPHEFTNNPMLSMLLSFLLTIITAIALDLIFISMGTQTIADGLVISAVIGVFIVAANMLSDYIFSNVRFTAFLIQGTYRLIVMLVLAAVLMMWR